MIDDVRRFILENSLLSKGDKVIVSLSGGPDSVALLLLMIRLKTEFKLEVCAFHLNHCIRGDEAERDELFCKQLCEKHGIKLYSMTEDIPSYAEKNKLSVEAAGRERRYALLDELCDEFDIGKIATGHTLDDNVETVLLNIIRGTGLNGLCGIRAKRGRIIRPLLDIKKSRLTGYLEDEGQEYAKDSTNYETDYLRNYIRNDVIPGIESKTGKDLLVTVSRMIKNLLTDSQFIETKTSQTYARIVYKTDGVVRASTEEIKKESRAIASRIIFWIVRELNGSSADITEAHIEALLELLDKQSGSQLDLPCGLRAKIEFGEICIYKNITKKSNLMPDAVKLSIPGRTVYNGHIFYVDIIKGENIVNNMFKKDTNRICLDYGKISGMDIVIRKRNQGDVFSPRGRNVTKKLKKYLIEARIPAGRRDDIPMLAVGNEIIWMPGIDFTDKYDPGIDPDKILVCEYNYSEVLHD